MVWFLHVLLYYIILSVTLMFYTDAAGYIIRYYIMAGEKKQRNVCVRDVS